MSKIGKQPIEIPANVEAKLEGQVFSVKGPQGSLNRELRPEIDVKIDGNTITVMPKNSKDVFSLALWGTYASHIKNMIHGVVTPFEKKLIIEGIGFKSEVAGKELVMSLGFSHQVKVAIPEDLKVTAEKNVLSISGIDKEKVGQFASKVRSLKKPEPYKGKGIRYDDEVIRRKQGKKSA